MKALGTISVGMILKAEYAATASIWRPEAEMQKYFLFMLLGQMIIAKYFTFLFIKGYEGTGMMEGVRYGLLIGFLFMGTYFVQFAVSPITVKILVGWCLGSLAQGVLGGMLLTVLYKR
ncbi:MAG: hypothetical protein KDD51_14760 [Bdellovibrionales bacterium]|nr:hypothetical protein [Bdellovibrionales bacterium]